MIENEIGSSAAMAMEDFEKRKDFNDQEQNESCRVCQKTVYRCDYGRDMKKISSVV